MSYDEGLAERVRDILEGEREVSEKKMFGGLAFLLGGRMSVGIVKDELMVRVGRERNDEALAQPHARPMDFTGHAMKGFVFVSPAGIESDQLLERWVSWGIEGARSAQAGPAKRPHKKQPARSR
jgi:TfoX/Sxy family transcriptional regulator of competence genes